MKRFFLIGSGLIVLLIIAAFTVPFLVPKSVYKTQIERAASEALQRDVTVSGDVSISVFPRISASVARVTVANPDGFATPHMIDAGELRGSVKWIPLLSRRVDVQEIAFVDATVFLQKTADGRTNWEFSQGRAAASEEESNAGRGFEAGVESAVLKNASLTFRDDAADTTYELKELDLRASLRAMDRPLGAEASGKFQGLDFSMSLTLDTPAALNASLPAVLELDLSSDLANIDYTGTLQLDGAPALDGAFTTQIENLPELARHVSLSLPASTALGRMRAKGVVKGSLDTLAFSDLEIAHDSDLLTMTYSGDASLGDSGNINGDVSIASDRLRDLLAAADVSLAPGDTLRTFSAAGRATGSFESIMLNGLDMKLDALSASGKAGLNLSGATPRIVGELVMPALDLTPFMGSADEQPRSSQGIQPWSQEPLNLDGLKAVNAQLDLDVARLVAGDLVLTDAETAITLTDGKLTADMTEFSAFGGVWQGRLAVDTRPATPTINLNMQGQNVAIVSLLDTFAGFDSLTGTGNFNISTTASGASLDDMVQGLNGSVSTDLSDGIIRGLNVTALVRTAASLRQAVTAGSLENLDFNEVLSENAETDFSSFNTALTVTNGVANVDVMKLLSPVLGIDGTGNINLAEQTMDLRLATSIDKSAQGQGSVVQLNGIPVPVRISGAWSNPKVRPDLSGVGNALKAELGNRLLNELGLSTESPGENARDALGGLLGIDQSGTQEAETPDGSEEETSREDLAIQAIGDLISNRRKKNDESAPDE